ncbi:TetR/AcrR family transcriptional regulator [Virgibacillus flavescens]|uniref:TetR/AcrR family transcriptional regulator n=1 Tax=Virgibacillus flavescens TaxID=1611422 RepID=UPI003D326B4E
MKSKQNRSPGRPRSKDLELPTKDSILMAASRLFLENSYPNVSVDDVAKVCNVTKATVYYYYDSKAELFTETMVQMMERIRKRMHVLLQEDLPLRERLLNVTRAHLRATVNIDIEGITKGLKDALTTEQTKKMHNAKKDMHQAIETSFVDAVNDGEIPEINPAFAAQAYLSLVRVGNYKTTDNKSIFSNTEEAAEQIIEFFWRGLFPKN